MRVMLLALGLLAAAPAAAGAATAQSRHCSDMAREQHLKGRAATDFRKKCLAGAMTPKGPTAPVPNNEEAKAVVAPSGADRTKRSAECDAAADKRGLSAQSRKEFRMSCLATAGPTGEAETHNAAPGAGKAIKGIGINNYNRPPGAPVDKPPPR